MYISYYDNTYDNVTKIKDVIEILNSIKSDKRKNHILAIRGANDPQKRNKLKKKLDMVAFHSIMHPTRGIKNVVSSTHLAAIDIDHGQNGEPYDFESLRKKLIKDKYVMSLFSSPSGRLKLLVRHNCDTVDNKEFHKFYDQLRSYFMCYAYSDPATCSLASTTYLSWDPELYLNEKSEIFPYRPKVTTTSPQSISSGNSLHQFPLPSAWLGIKEAFDYMDSVVQFYNFKTNRNCNLYKFACGCAKNGVSPEHVRMYVEEIILASDFPITEIEKTIRSAYKSIF